MAVTNALEQYMLELINRARDNPRAEARRLGVELNDGLRPGTISADPKEPLAIAPELSDAAVAHTRYMLRNNTLEHLGRDGSTPDERMLDAGWDPGTGADTWWGQNFAAYFTRDPGVDSQPTFDHHHELLFGSPTGRQLMLFEEFNEIGIGSLEGPYEERGVTYPHTSVVTQKYAESAREFITGVVFDDRNANGFYDVGEGLTDVRVTVTGEDVNETVKVNPGGGYRVKVPRDAEYEVRFKGDGFTATEAVEVKRQNVKVDHILAPADDEPGPRPDPMPEPKPDRDNSLRGTKTDDVLIGTDGDDRIAGRPGDDALQGRAGDDLLGGGAGNDTLFGQEGDDRMYGAKDRDVMYGDDGDDKMNGNAGKDEVYGGAGRDYVRGGVGEDTLWGGAGDDVYIGGRHADLFVYEEGTDAMDYQPGSDRIDLTALNLTSFAEDVAPRMRQTKLDTIIDFDGEDMIVLKGVKLDSVLADDFLL